MGWVAIRPTEEEIKGRVNANNSTTSGWILGTWAMRRLAGRWWASENNFLGKGENRMINNLFSPPTSLLQLCTLSCEDLMPRSAAMIWWHEANSMRMESGMLRIVHKNEQISYVWQCHWFSEPTRKLLFSVLFVNKTIKTFFKKKVTTIF